MTDDERKPDPAGWNTIDALTRQLAEVTAERHRDDDLLMSCDSLLSLIRYREATGGLSRQTLRDLDALIGRLRVALRGER